MLVATCHNLMEKTHNMEKTPKTISLDETNDEDDINANDLPPVQNTSDILAVNTPEVNEDEDFVASSQNNNHQQKEDHASMDTFIDQKDVNERNNDNNTHSDYIPSTQPDLEFTPGQRSSISSQDKKSIQRGANELKKDELDGKKGTSMNQSFDRGLKTMFAPIGSVSVVYNQNKSNIRVPTTFRDIDDDEYDEDDEEVPSSSKSQDSSHNNNKQNQTNTSTVLCSHNNSIENISFTRKRHMRDIYNNEEVNIRLKKRKVDELDFVLNWLSKEEEHFCFVRSQDEKLVETIQAIHVDWDDNRINIYIMSDYYHSSRIESYAAPGMMYSHYVNIAFADNISYSYKHDKHSGVRIRFSMNQSMYVPLNIHVV